jgi:hypothetical protein
MASGVFFCAGYTPRRRISLVQKTQKSNADSKLIIVCGLPGAGKTTHAKRLEETLGAVRFCPDEWMAALALDLYDEARRAKIESLQWKLSRDLLVRGGHRHYRVGDVGAVGARRLAVGSKSARRGRGTALPVCADRGAVRAYSAPGHGRPTADTARFAAMRGAVPGSHGGGGSAF